MNSLQTRIFEDRSLLDDKLALTVANALSVAVDLRGKAILVVSGGSTPIGFFRRLADKQIDWHLVSVLVADERWVEPDHGDSNEKLVRENLLKGGAGAANFISLKTSALNAVDAEPEIETRLAALAPFDVLILGMGGDGHTASLFPDATNLEQGVDLTSGRQCIAVDPTMAPHQRMSMTLPRLLNSREIIVHITGKEKKAVFDQARTQNNALLLPIAAVINQQTTPVTLYYSP